MGPGCFALLLATSITGGCATETLLMREHILGLGTSPEGELIYPTEDGDEVIPPDAEITLTVTRGAPRILGRSSPRQASSRPGDVELSIDLGEDDLWRTPTGLGVRIAGRTMLVPLESLQTMSIREEDHWTAFLVIASAATLAAGLVVLVLVAIASETAAMRRAESVP